MKTIVLSASDANAVDVFQWAGVVGVIIAVVIACRIVYWHYFIYKKQKGVKK